MNSEPTVKEHQEFVGKSIIVFQLTSGPACSESKAIMPKCLINQDIFCRNLALLHQYMFVLGYCYFCSLQIPIPVANALFAPYD